MLKVMIVFGTRPEAIKMAPLIKELQKANHEIELSTCITAQHREMLDQVLQIFGIKPDIDLNIMKKNQDLSELTAEILIKMRNVLKVEQPHLVLVHGDTTTTFATALACFYEQVKLGHVEAGLRTNNLSSPYPEEFNRQIVSKIAHLHFAPTQECKTNLLRENINEEAIFVTGNTVIDSLQWVIKSIEQDEETRAPALEELEELVGFDLTANNYILITGHRRENFGKGFEEICTAIAGLAKNFPNIHFVYPVHLNPNVQGPVYEKLGRSKNIHLIQPQNYINFSILLRHCKFVITDSGGLQEEAPSLGKPVLLMRETTERPEAINAGTVKLVGPDSSRIIENASELLTNNRIYEQMATSQNPFGNGDASVRICGVILSQFVL